MGENFPSDMTKDTLSTFLDQYSGCDIIAEFPDLNGVSRSKIVSAEKLAKQGEISMQLSVLALSPSDTFSTDVGYGESVNFADGTLHPDLSTATEVPWRTDTARVICDFKHHNEPVEGYSRHVLQRVIESLPSELKFGIGAELEFFLMKGEAGNREPITTDRNECVTFATESVSDFYRRLKTWGNGIGLNINAIHKEEAVGQYEVLFDHEDPLSAADSAFNFRRVVRRAADSVDLHGTFMPKPLSDQPGSGCHLHLSAHKGDSNVFANEYDSLTDTGASFVAGVLDHIDALCAICNPTLNSFKRQRGGYFAATTASWGYDNRLALIRIPPKGDPRIEVRLPSSDSNPYLSIAGILAAGMDGVQRNLSPPEPTEGEPGDELPSLPRSLEQGLAALGTDSVLRDAFGAEMIEVFCGVKRAELDEFYSQTTEWEREEYLDNL